MSEKYWIIPLIILSVFIGFGTFKRFTDDKQLEAQRQSLNKRIPNNTKYILSKDNECPDGYVEVHSSGEGMDFLIPAGTLVIENGNPGAKRYHLYAKRGEQQPLLPPVKE